MCYKLLRRFVGGGVCQSSARLDGKVVIVTGSNTGIGKETARDLAGRGAKVILACRNLEKAQTAADEIIRVTDNNNVIVREVDLASFASVRKFAENILKTESRLDILINNAGLIHPYRKTEDGYEWTFQINHLSPFLLTNLLLDLLKKSGPSRVVTVSSVVHKGGSLNFDDLNYENRLLYTSGKGYADSKLCNILFAKELARRCKGTGVSSFSLHPGTVQSEFGRDYFIFRLGMAVVKPFILKTSQEGAQTSIYCAVTEGLEAKSGEYFSDCAVARPGQNATDLDIARQLWEISEEMTGLTSKKTV